MDIYSTKAQLAAVELLPREYSALYDFFGKEAGVVEDDKAIYDFRKGSKRMAPTVKAGTGGVLMDRDGFETREIGFATIAPERIIEDQNIKGRMFGERVLGALTPQEREKKMLAKDLSDMRAAIQRRREWMVRQVILDGQLQIFTYTNEGRGINPTMIADYGFDNYFTPTTNWDQAGATIDYDMHQIYDLVYDGGGAVEFIFMAPNVAQALLANEKYVRQYDLRNAEMGNINTQYRGSGLRFIGYNSDGVELYSLSGSFVDDDGSVVKLIPDGKLIAGSRGCLNIFHGPVTQVEETGMNAQHKTYIKKEVPLRYGSIAGNCVKNRLTSCPTVVPANVDGWAVATVM